MTKEGWAALLNGRVMGDEMTVVEEKAAATDGVLVIYGYSDDNVELRGAIHDEIGAYEGTTLMLTRSTVLGDHDDCECDFCGYKKLVANCKSVEAVWCDKVGAPAWTYKTDVPHATFDIHEDETIFCRGIVIDVNDLPIVAE